MAVRYFIRQLDDNAERWLLLVFYGLIVATIIVEVVRRFALSYSSIWGEEVARYAFIYLAWVGAAAAVKDRAHIRIDVLLHFVGERLRTLLYIFADLVALALAILVFYWSLETIATSLKFGSVSHGLRISLVWFLAAVPLGFFLVIVRLVQSLLRDLRALRAGTPAFQGAQLFD